MKIIVTLYFAFSCRNKIFKHPQRIIDSVSSSFFNLSMWNGLPFILLTSFTLQKRYKQSTLRHEHKTHKICFPAYFKYRSTCYLREVLPNWLYIKVPLVGSTRTVEIWFSKGMISRRIYTRRIKMELQSIQ